MVLSFDDQRKPPYTKQQAMKFVRKFLQSSTFSRDYVIGFSIPHFQQRLKERKLNINDALNIMKTGMIYNEPEYETTGRNGYWRYAIEGDLISKRGKGRLVISIASEREIQCITIISGIRSNRGKR